MVGYRNPPGRDVPHVVYRMFDADDRLIYVGMTAHLDARIRAHQKSKPWAGRVSRITMDSYPDRTTALVAELTAIRNEAPECNVVGNPGRQQRQPVRNRWSIEPADGWQPGRDF